MDNEAPGLSTTENRVSCSCSSTCSMKRGRTANRGCPCKTEGVTCGPACKCGSTAKPCRNKPGGSTSLPSAVANRRPQPYSADRDRPSEEEERIKENNDVKEFIQTLDDGMVRRLCVRSLRRGVGSMDYIQGLLIMEDDLDEDANGSNLTPTPGTSTDEQLGSSDTPTPDPDPPSGSTALPWCRCGVCRIMPQEIENKCCSLRKCVTSHTRFAKLCLDPDVLQLAIRNRGDIRNDRDDNSTRSFRKSAYRQYVLDRYGYLGKGNRKVCPSCVVNIIRSRYPSQTGVYMGFRAD